MKIDFEKIHDDVKLKIKQSLIQYNIQHNYIDPSVFTLKDIGIKSRIELDSGRDNGITNEEIQRAIDKSSKILRKEEKKPAIQYLEKIMSTGFYGYLKLAKLLGVPRETFVVRTWYGKYLPKIPSLVNPGGEIRLREGQYNISDTIVPNNYILLSGTGLATVLKLNNSVNKDVIAWTTPTDLRSFCLSNLKIDGNKGNQSGTSRLIYLVKPSTIYIDKVELINAYSQSILLGTQPAEIRVILVENSWIHNNGSHGIDITPSDTIIANCDIGANVGSGIYYNAGSDNGISSVVHVWGNTLQGFDLMSHGIQLVGCQSESNVQYGIKTLSGHRHLIANCEIRGNTLNGLNIGGSGYTTITGCLIFLNRQHGLSLSLASHCSIISNSFSDNSQQTNNTYDDILLYDNGSSYCTYNTIIGNSIDCTLANKSKYGIVEVSSGDDYNIVIGNVIQGAVTSNIRLLGTHSVQRNNIGHVTENSGSSTGTGAQQTIAHGLAIIPARQQIALIAGSATALPFHSADPDGTNIYVTAALNQPWYWATVGT